MRTEVQRIELIIWGEPIAQPRPTADGRGKFVRVVSAKAGSPVIAFKENINLMCRRAMADLRLIPQTGPLFLNLDLVWERNKRDKKLPDKRLWKATRPDCDNVAKAILDALNGVLFVDDNQVVGLVVRKYFGRVGEGAHVRVGLQALNHQETSEHGEASTQNRRSNGGQGDDRQADR